MKVRLSTASDIGPFVRAARKAQGLRQDDTAGAVGVSENFLGKVEHGADTAQWNKLFQVLQGLGIHVDLDLPEETLSYLPKGAELD